MAATGSPLRRRCNTAMIPVADASDDHCITILNTPIITQAEAGTINL
ncbi:MAG: hypothetical protein CHKLHMKO_00397 [Candidatus Argoarchaeum ethanivorans]|uniref:Uncharacterized protein n=1 Tax=Candidatus Argoarchaeum ethanivorans TaxID=2608793 RepID=A0A811TE62_9EURY|nr:MAG: hypothetical protein CHKLHMKO_00397 [Candidatus Argoarchaeum ethanivorans]